MWQRIITLLALRKKKLPQESNEVTRAFLFAFRYKIYMRFFFRSCWGLDRSQSTSHYNKQICTVKAFDLSGQIELVTRPGVRHATPKIRLRRKITNAKSMRGKAPFSACRPYTWSMGLIGGNTLKMKANIFAFAFVAQSMGKKYRGKIAYLMQKMLHEWTETCSFVFR